ncbi:PGF-pre-PGF domain-containing protein [Methanolobus vulcani]|uniref:PGF-pre-PGF domain-containing protein n=2 Tax=Methanolobus vulcani TaxID=38026 RepID=A0A7Z7FDL7_9EURY|nr:PGF-pre-PGF domain-containing protein [Methanolobus vulcani]
MKNPLLSNHLLFACCIVLILLSSCCAATENDTYMSSDQNDSSPGILIAPLNPAFVEYQQELVDEQKSVQVNSNDLTFSSLALPVSSKNNVPSETFDHPTGLIPSPVDLSHLSPVSMDYLMADDTIKTSGLELMSSEVSYPSCFDLREHNGVTAVRDQGQAGSCWTHSATASLESYLLFNRSETWDFSENNIKDTLVSSNPDGFTRTYDDGGFDLFDAAYYSRWSGPVLESDDPYNDHSGFSPDNLPVAKHVQEIMILPGFEGNDTLYKWMLTHYGAISVAIMQDDSYFDSDNNSYYYNGPVVYANHAVTLVGWDDNYSAQNFTPTAPGNGAFIIKNSWGDSWGEDGFYYVSYYDTVMGNDEGIDGIGTKPYAGNFLYTAENVSNYGRVYQYDELGWVGCAGYNNSTASGANIFTASSNETLEAVSFYTVDSNSIYNISVYLNPESGPVNSSGPVSVQNGTIAIAGYHTIDLDTNVSLNAGQNFSVVVEFTTPNYTSPIAIEKVVKDYSENAHAEAGQSFMSFNGSQWTDISDSNMNVCIKAFTTENKEPDSAFVAGTRYVHVNETVDFHDVSLFSPESWEWDFGDNSTSSLQNPLHSYSETGIYTVSLNASNSYGNNTSVRTSFIQVLNSTIVVNSSGSADFTTITEAINAASDGDTVVIEPGTYTENLYLDTDNISILSSTGNPEDVRIVSEDSSEITIYLIADNVNISGINAVDGYIGILVYFSEGCNISNCSASGNTYGIYFYYSQDNSVSNCTSDENTYGLRLRGSENNILNDNSMNNNTFNSYFDSNANIVGTDNLVDGKPIYYLVNSSDQVLDASSNAGIVYLFNCSNVTVEDLEIENNYCGFYLYDSDNVSIDNCTSTDNRYGVYLSSSDNNTIYSCNISDISTYGLSLVDCSDNLIYNNYFNSSANVYVSGGTSNDWNITMANGINIINESYLGGNFWAKPDNTGWSQTEYSIGNGFCDAYEITDDGNNTDYLPLTLNSVQPAVSDDSSSHDDGIRVKIATITSSASNIVATDSSVRFVGKDAEVKYVFTGDSTPVNEISFESGTNQGYVMATVSLLNELPESSPAPSSVSVYQGMDILLGDEDFSSGIGDAKISFSVSREWLESNGFVEGDIRMEHFSDGIWNTLPTVVTGEDDEYIYFEATTTGFSPFIICVDISGDGQVNAGSSSGNKGDTAVSENIIPDVLQDSDQSRNNSVRTLTTLSGLIVATILGLVFKMKKSE